IVLLGVGGIFLITRYRNPETNPATENEEEQVEEDENEDEALEVDEVEIALLDNERTSGSEIERGCDLVTFTTRSITPTTAPLTAAMEELFGLEDAEVDGYYNFIANTNDTLTFDRAEVV